MSKGRMLLSKILPQTSKKFTQIYLPYLWHYATLNTNTFTFHFYSHCDIMMYSVIPQQSQVSDQTRHLQGPAKNTQNKHSLVQSVIDLLKCPRNWRHTCFISTKERCPTVATSATIQAPMLLVWKCTLVFTVKKCLSAVNSVSTLAERLIYWRSTVRSIQEKSLSVAISATTLPPKKVIWRPTC